MLENTTEQITSIQNLIDYFESDNDTVWKENIYQNIWYQSDLVSYFKGWNLDYIEMINDIQMHFNHNGYLAMRVKYHHLNQIYLSDEDAQFLYDELVSVFWLKADLLARSFGYKSCMQDGRSGGWLLPTYDQRISIHDLSTYPDFEKYIEMQKFLEFTNTITMLKNLCACVYHNTKNLKNIHTVTNRIYTL